MSVRIGINGFGRIARVCIRSLARRKDDAIICCINQRNADYEKMAYLLKYDSVFGRFQAEVLPTDTGISINGNEIVVLSENEPAKIDWAGQGIDIVIESTGAFRSIDQCREHLKGGAKKVVLTAPGKESDFPTFVMGVNEDTYDSSMDVVSNASCTTNCLAPLSKVINDTFGIKEGLMSTIHASTSKQKPVDSNGGRDWRTGRSVFNNIIPSSTGAAKAVGLVIPELNGKLTGMSFRVPTNDISVIDLTAKLEKKTSYEEICGVVKKASETYMKGIIEYNSDEIVSGDVRKNPNTCVFDEKAGIMLNEDFVKLIAWYDNEWGYSNKVLDLAMHIAKVEGYC